MVKRKQIHFNLDHLMNHDKDNDPRLNIFKDKSLTTISKAWEYIQDEAKDLLVDINDPLKQKDLMILMKEEDMIIVMGEDETERFERIKNNFLLYVHNTIVECKENMKMEESEVYLLKNAAKRIYDHVKILKTKYESYVDVLRTFPVTEEKKHSVWNMVIDYKFVWEKMDNMTFMIYGIEALIEKKEDDYNIKKRKIDNNESINVDKDSEAIKEAIKEAVEKIEEHVWENLAVAAADIPN